MEGQSGLSELSIIMWVSAGEGCLLSRVPLYCSYTCSHANADITLSPPNLPAGGHSRSCLLVYEPEALAAVHKEEDQGLCPRGGHQQQGSETHFIAGQQCREGCPVA